jgi:ribose 5-phosphate isomerase B
MGAFRRPGEGRQQSEIDFGLREMSVIALGCDHVGLSLKEPIKEYLESINLEVSDFGCFSGERTDYPKYALEVGRAVMDGRCGRGILFCGTGIGISIAANKVRGIRAAVCSEPYSAKLSKVHNNTNILCLGSRVVGVDLAKMIVDEWLNAEFEAGRHSKRISMIEAIEIDQSKE